MFIPLARYRAKLAQSVGERVRKLLGGRDFREARRAAHGIEEPAVPGEERIGREALDRQLEQMETEALHQDRVRVVWLALERHRERYSVKDLGFRFTVLA